MELVDGRDEKEALPRGFRITDDRASRPAFEDLESFMTRVTLNESQWLASPRESNGAYRISRS